MRYGTEVIGAILAVLFSLAGGSSAMAQDNEQEAASPEGIVEPADAAGAAGEVLAPEPEPAAQLKFLYLSCNSLDEMRRFYSDLLGMQETAYLNEDGLGWLCYQCGTLEVMFFTSGYALPVLADWAMQPGWPGGVLEGISWSVEVPGARFAAAVDKLKAGGVPTFAQWPLWAQDSYWSFPVRDPMGNTVEVYTVPQERPASTDWPAE